MIEALPLPPEGVMPRGVHGRLVSAHRALANTIPGHQHTLSVFLASSKEREMLRIELSAERPGVGIVTINSVLRLDLNGLFQNRH